MVRWKCGWSWSGASRVDESKLQEVDGVVAPRLNFREGLRERAIGAWRQADLVGIYVYEQIGFERRRELFLAFQLHPQIEHSLARQVLDPDDPALQVTLGNLNRPVRGSVVYEIHLDALPNEVL
jgi:hypothetical protein